MVGVHRTLGTARRTCLAAAHTAALRCPHTFSEGTPRRPTCSGWRRGSSGLLVHACAASRLPVYARYSCSSAIEGKYSDNNQFNTINNTSGNIKS